MSWFTKDRRHKMPAADVAQSLFQVMVEEESEVSNAAEYDVPESLRPQFDAKTRLYREATVLMLLIASAEKEQKYRDVLTAFESFFLPPRPTYEGMVKLETLKGAMRHLSALLKPEHQAREFTWSMGWLAEIGHKETNPVRLMQFSLYWMTTYEAVAKSIAQLRPD